MSAENPIPNFKVHIPPESVELVKATLESGWIGGDGPKVKEFEAKLAEIIGNENVLAVNSGTSALELGLKLAGVAGHEVISTPMTCFATSAAIINSQADIAWADVDPATGNIDPADIEHRINSRTRAIMVVHWGGSPCELDEINQIAARHGISVIEDAAQALGSKYKGEPIGTHSDFVAMSFQAIKIVNTADGGLLATKRRTDYHRGKKLRWYGIDREERQWDERGFFWEYPIEEVGHKIQMTDIAASLGLGQLPYLEGIINHRTKLAGFYEDALENVDSLKAQKVLPHARSNYWIFTVIAESLEAKTKLWQEMRKIGVKVEEAHKRNDTYPVLIKNRKEELPGVTHFNNNHLIVPVGHWVSEEKAREIAGVLGGFE